MDNTTPSRPPEFDADGRLIAGYVSDRTSTAIVRFRNLEYERLKMTRLEGELEDAVSCMPAGEMAAYVDATEKIAQQMGEKIAAIQDRHRARREARLAGRMER